jgi:RNA polymerase sigma-70 factor (ECF subfamily)
MKDVSAKTDQEIVSLSKENADYFGHIIDRYQEKLSRYITRISNPSKEDKEDILQNVFILVYKNINSYNSEMNFNSWIYRICHNEVISFWRKSKKYNNNISINDEEYENIENIFGDNDLGFNMEKKDAEIISARILSEIDLKYREVLILKFVEGYSYEEISDILKKPSGTVGTLISRAKAQFINRSKKYYEQD